MKTVVIIQARMSSSRLPGKVMIDIAGQPMLARVISRVQQTTIADEIIIATSTEPEDDELAAVCRQHDWPCFRGSHLDVLDRFYQAASAFSADIIVRVSCDCPMIDPDITDRVAGKVINSAGTVDYAANMLPPRTFPRGVDVEAFTFEALSKCWHESHTETCREHVTPYIYLNPDQFRILRVTNATDESCHRWTVDTPEDLELLRLICGHLGDSDFRWLDVVELCKRNPHWSQLNAHIQQRAVA
ncbi:MAG: glycosyltransferase family protein [Fuerstiella sp.]|nr:glycosyltransferase family protein [Fuerstiella sp.]